MDLAEKEKENQSISRTITCIYLLFFKNKNKAMPGFVTQNLGFLSCEGGIPFSPKKKLHLCCNSLKAFNITVIQVFFKIARLPVLILSYLYNNTFNIFLIRVIAPMELFL